MNRPEPSDNESGEKEKTKEIREASDQDSKKRDGIQSVSIKSGQYESDVTDSKKNGIPTIVVKLTSNITVLRYMGSYPRAVINMLLDFNGDYHNPHPMAKFSKGTEFHIVLLDLEKWMHIVDDHLFDKDDNGKPRSLCQLQSFKHLRWWLKGKRGLL
ncbi:hypothetical protein G6011_09949 [Alternaria panax]|uniref:Uncharacterized protein n=1 Tax=Alternaria panax TaxID=48097 RepID=A0AAD4FD15_9PLEO|nr:hypothetical protein G6011_09949 [Alternaria panax]